MAMWWAAVCLSLQSWSGTRDGFRLCYMDYVGLHTTRAYSHTVRSDSNQACWFLGVWMIRRCVCMPLRLQIPAYSVDEPYDEWNNWITAVHVFSHWRFAAFVAGVVMIWALSFSPSQKKWHRLLSSNYPFDSHLCTFLSMCADKSRAFSPLADGKKIPGADDIRAVGLGRPVMSPYQLSPRDMAKFSHEQLLHYNPCKTILPCLKSKKYDLFIYLYQIIFYNNKINIYFH